MASNSIYGIIVAAGSGNRFGSKTPKQFRDLGGKPMLFTTISRMAEAISLSNIVLVIDKKMDRFWHDLCARCDFDSPRVVYGGASRGESVSNALDYLYHSGADPASTVLIHDGARPLATPSLYKSLTIIPADSDGIIPVVSLTDSIRYLVDGKHHSTDRSKYVAVQTPQSFRLGQLRDAYIRCGTNGYTDDASIAEAAGLSKIRLSPGEPSNIKVTNPIDLAIAEAILNQNAKIDK